MLSPQWTVPQLIQQAIKARQQSYSPYSQFAVGAALLSTSGKIYRGCNIENSSYGLTICAERVAIGKAVSEGDRQFSQIVITTQRELLVPPCGACLQVLNEFVPHDFEIILASSTSHFEHYFLHDFLPRPFSFDSHVK